MPVINLSRSGLQAGDHACLRIQAHMGFVAKKIFGLFDFLAFLGFHLAFVLDPPPRIGIMWAFAFLFAFLVFGGIHIGDAVDTVDYLDRTKFHPLVSGDLHDLFQHLFEHR